ncbi:MAG: hypothetical protein HS117_19325 [Verrucomicrobiaceae bacterium]|nr:hypothetical protein [Verrucomicrobiaceae bacterium]
MNSPKPITIRVKKGDPCLAVVIKGPQASASCTRGSVEAAVACAAKSLRCSAALVQVEHTEDAAGFSFYKATIRPEPDLFNTGGVS